MRTSVPCNLLNYAAGVTGIPSRNYVLGTAVGLVPGAVVYAAFGGALDAPASPAFLAAAGGIGAFLAAGVAAKRHLRRR